MNENFLLIIEMYNIFLYIKRQSSMNLFHHFLNKKLEMYIERIILNKFHIHVIYAKGGF